MSPSSRLDKLGDYEILHALKSGGMGDVLLARKLGAGGFERLVAIKTIKSELRTKSDLRAMFLDEARLLSQLSHPCLAQVYDFGEEPDGTLLLAMEYVAGVRFTELMRREVDPCIAARAMAQVCRGLHAAHELTDLDGQEMGVVHRDVTPENLILTFEGRVKVLDFGIALVRGRTAPVTEYGTIKGKPPYLSPEQIKNQPLDRRTDIFSASVVLHELLTGEMVYTGDSVYAIARAIETEDVEPPSRSVGPLPEGLDDVVMAGLHRDPEQRFQNGLAMAEALERVANRADGESLEAYARRELAGDQAEHRRWLRDLLSKLDQAPVTSAGRASGVMTAMSGPSSPQVEFGAAEPVARERGPEASTADELRVLEQGRGRPARWIAFLLLLAGVVGGGLYMMKDGCGQPRATALGLDAAPMPAADAAVAVAVALAPKGDARVLAVTPSLSDARSKRPPGRDPRPERARADSAKTDRAKTDPAKTDPAKTDPAKTDPAKTDPAPVGTGYLTIVAEPFANIRIDGVDYGSTPIFRRSIAAGRHEIVLVQPDSNAVRLRRTVTLADGDHKRIEP